MLFLLVPTTAFAQLDLSATSNETTSGFESFTGDSLTSVEPVVTSEPVVISTTTFESHNISTNSDGTEIFTTHTPYVFDGQQWVSYILTDTPDKVTLQVSGATLDFNKITGAVTIFDDNETIIDSDSYVVRTALLNSDVWNNLSVNDGIVTTTVEELDDSVTVSFIRENIEGLFKTEYVIGNGEVKTTVYFTNYIYDNNKFAFTQTLNLPDSIISLNDMEDIDLTNFVGQSFPREVLEQNEDLILNIKDMYYNSGLGFENLWSVNVTSPTKVSLDYANVDQVQTAIGETVELDPTWSYGGLSWGDRYIIYSQSGVSGTNCSTTWTVYLGNGANYLSFPSSGSTSNCYLPVDQFNISTLPTTATITGVSMSYDIFNSSLPRNCDFVAIDATRATATSTNVINEITTGTVMLANDSACASGIGSYTANFGSAGVTELTNDMSNGNSHFVVGIKPSVGIVRDANTHQQIANNQKLIVTYSLPPDTPLAPVATLNANGTIDLAWTAANFNGIGTGGFGTTAGGYEIYQNGVKACYWGTGALNGSLIGCANAPFYGSLHQGTLVNQSLPSGAMVPFDGSAVVGTPYSFTIKAQNTSGLISAMSPASNVVEIPTDAPTGLTATNNTPNVDLSWTSPTGATGYRIATSTDGTTFTDVIANTGNTNTTYSHTSPTLGSINYYKIYSIGNTSESIASATVNVTTGNVPDAPTGLTATNNTPNVDLSWTAPANVNGSVITGYKVETSLDGITWSVITANTGSATTTYSHTTPTIGSLNYYKVSAINGYGIGANSNTDNVMAGTPPDPPTITGTSIASPNVTPLDIIVNWSSPLNTGTAGISNFEVYRDTILITTVGNVNTYTDTVPSGGGTFVYSLKSVTPHGTSILSGTASQTTPTVPPAPISAPTLNIANANTNPFDVTVSFAMPSSGGSAITSFEIFRSIDNVTFASVGTTTQLIFYDTVPNAGTFYYKFASTNLVGTGTQSPSSNITTANVPGTINDLLATPISQTQIDLTFSAPSNGGSNIVEYKIIRDGVQIATSVVPSYTDTTVLTQTSYTFEIITNNNVGDSANSNQSIALTFGVPDAPVVTVSQNSITSLDLSWTIPADYNSAITGYKIERNDGSGYVIELANTGTVGTTYNVIGLTPISEYTFRISAINAYGTGPGGVNSNWTNPTAPTGLSVIPDSTSTNLDLYWDSNVSATGYKIERETGIGNGWSVLTADTGNTNTTYQDTGLTDNIFYNYRISTVTSVGNSVPSSTYAQTTFHLPDPVVSLTADDGLAGTVALSWTAPAAPYGSILGYTIYQVTAPGTAATATATLSTTLDQISSVTITNPGALYLSAPTVTISIPGGVAPFTTATATAVITGGVVTGITVTNVGDGYNTPPTVTISVPAGNTIVGVGTVLTPVISDTLSTLTTYSLPVADPAATYSFAVAPITVHGSTILGAGIVSISPDQVFEGITINIANEVNPVQAPIIFTKTVIGNDTNLMMTYSSSLNLTCETTTPFTTGKTTYANLAETPLGNGKVTHTMTFQNSDNTIVDVFCFDQSNPTVNGQARITQNIIPLKTQMDDFSNGVFSTGSTFAAIDLMTLVVVIVGMIGFNRKNPAVGLALMAGILGILSIFQIITMTTTAIGGFILIVFLAIIMGLKNR